METIKPTKPWLQTCGIYEQVIGSAMSDADKTELFVYESQGKKAFEKMFNRKTPRALHYKAAFDLLNTEILDTVKYSYTFDHWYFLYKTDTFFDHNLNREILEFILKDKALSEYQIEIQEILWKGLGEIQNRIERAYCGDVKVARYVHGSMWQRLRLGLLSVTSWPLYYRIAKEAKKISDKEYIARIYAKTNQHAQRHYAYLGRLRSEEKYYNVAFQKQSHGGY